MTFISHQPGYAQLKDQLIAATGLVFYADRDELLTDLIEVRLRDLGIRNCLAYLKFLNDGEKGEAEMDILVGRLTIGETYFFRDQDQFDAIREIILPDIIQRNRQSQQIRIWSAGCATGAEPYSLAILLAHHLAEKIAGWRICIYASDLNRSYLAQAQAGKFRPWALRSTSEEMKRECFSNEGRLWHIHPRYKKWISFRYMNLVDGDLSSPEGQFDLILCRNVMIYFAPEVNRRLVGRFHLSLDDGGWLVVGASEHNPENYSAFRTVSVPGAKLYQKETAEEFQPPVKPEPLSSPPVSSPASVWQPRVNFLVNSAPPPPESGEPDMEGLRKLADHGAWADAAEYAQDLLSRDRLNPVVHFYQALIFENLGMLEKSLQSLRHAIYLDRRFALAHYHLGLALQRSPQPNQASRSFANVLKALMGLPDDGMVKAGPGVTVAALRELATMQSPSPGLQEIHV